MNNTSITPLMRWGGLAAALLALTILAFVLAGRVLGGTTARAETGGVRGLTHTSQETAANSEATEAAPDMEKDIGSPNVTEPSTEVPVAVTESASGSEGGTQTARHDVATAATTKGNVKEQPGSVLAERDGVIVSNATQLKGLAHEVAERLRKHGVPVASVGNFEPKPQITTVLLVTPGQEALASQVTRVLGDLPQRRHGRLQAGVVVVLGEDHGRLERDR